MRICWWECGELLVRMWCFGAFCVVAGCTGMLPPKATLCCHGAAFAMHSYPAIDRMKILPAGAIQFCHLNENDLDCQIHRSATVWRLR